MAIFSEVGAVPGIGWVLSVHLTKEYMDHSCPSAMGHGDHVSLGHLYW